MILTTMTDAEIRSEIEKDFPEIGKFSIYKDKDYRRAVIKSTRFPFTMLFTKKTKNNNKWMLIYEARTKKDRKDSRIHFIVINNSDKGLWCVMPTFANDQLHIIIYQPHFFSRYRERFKINFTGERLIYEYFSRNYDYVYEIQEKQLDDIHKVRECFGASKDGVALGVLTTSDNVFFKTFITYEMTKGQQIETFGKNEILRQEMTI